MRRTYLIRIAAVTLFLFAGNVYAQTRRPAPTGQVPKSYSGQPGSSYSEFKPKPTGQIAPAEGTIPQQTTNQAASQLSGNAQSGGVLQQGQVPKVNSNQDARTFPERYNPNPVTQSETTITTQETQTLPGQNQSTTAGQVIQTDVTTPTEQGNTNSTTTQTPQAGNQQQVNQQQTPNSRTANQSQTNAQQRTVTQPRAATTAPAVPASPQRLQPNY
ncbi:hypothetical protein [Dyadobacter sp. CY323]|uniref:hypothetical protein n=1 Tax=Dyadobacter sp. CY323 TaxID=2907302 RepID=UPI001F44F533|nr:hypothetical protein [Dyadobacter sp. CY323]MCE6990111.1 hypothetical protein [Dyadobacter sp. CY323]